MFEIAITTAFPISGKMFLIKERFKTFVRYKIVTKILIDESEDRAYCSRPGIRRTAHVLCWCRCDCACRRIALFKVRIAHVRTFSSAPAFA